MAIPDDRRWEWCYVKQRRPGNEVQANGEQTNGANAQSAPPPTMPGAMPPVGRGRGLLNLLEAQKNKTGGAGSTTKHPLDESVCNVIINHKKQKALVHCLHLYNILFGRIMNQLEMVQINRNYYSQKFAVQIPRHKLEVWPYIYIRKFK